jgi:hypothetical protein
MNIEPQAYLAKSEQGVYYTVIYQCQLYAWVLLEASKSRPTPQWVLKHHSHLTPSVPRQDHEGENGKEGVSDDRGDCEWEFTGDISVGDPDKQEDGGQSECKLNCRLCRRISFLGYHPYKEIAFLGTGHSKGFAYYLGTSKLRYLGSLHPMGFSLDGPTMQESFIYTPCEDDLLPTRDESIDTP